MPVESSRNSIELIQESLRENSMLMDISADDMNLIVNGKKTVIVHTKIPSCEFTSDTISKNKKIKVYLHNKSKGVWGECYCNLSFNNDMSKKQPLEFPYIINVSKKSYFYTENADKYLEAIRKQNKDINLDGTCLEYDDFIKLVTVGKFIFFIISELNIYKKPLGLDNFYIARWGKHGIFSPSNTFKAPRGWCYAMKKLEHEMM